MSATPAGGPKRFYKTAAAEPFEGGFAVLLDGRPMRTPRQSRLILPTQGLAALIAGEWAEQGEHILMGSMPATRLAFTAADQVAAKRAETVAEIVRFAASDLLCYFATTPAVLVERQTRRWSVVLDWAQETLGLRFVRVSGIIHQPQPDETLQRISVLVGKADDFTLAGVAFAASLYGSAILALALWRDMLDGEAAFDLSRLDEAFQEEQWGVDDEAAARTAHRRGEAIMLDRWFAALR